MERQPLRKCGADPKPFWPGREDSTSCHSVVCAGGPLDEFTVSVSVVQRQQQEEKVN